MPRDYPYIKTFHLNHSGVERIATGARVETAVRDIAQKAAVHARSITPAEAGHEYRQGFRIRVHVRDDWPHNSKYRAKRVCADLANVARYAIVLERGQKPEGSSREIQKFRILGKTLAHLRTLGKTSRRRKR
ncbi:hypothetical protein [Micromonospora chalcea]|uniref:hypothetical protein n=1 Tax=Micromonospora chalcea TaxID=1874 RepID=UPI003D71C062